MNATLHDPESDDLLAEIECYPAGRTREGVGSWRYGFAVIDEPSPLRAGLVVVKLEDGRVGRAIVKSLSFRSYQLRRSGTLESSGTLMGAG
jgi:hypothetical protein